MPWRSCDITVKCWPLCSVLNVLKESIEQLNMFEGIVQLYSLLYVEYTWVIDEKIMVCAYEL